jgi:hypothetical protein
MRNCGRPDSFGASIYQRGGNHLRVFAWLKPGVTLAQARADIATVTGSWKSKIRPPTATLWFGR